MVHFCLSFFLAKYFWGNKKYFLSKILFRVLKKIPIETFSQVEPENIYETLQACASILHCATFPSHIWSILWGKNYFFFSPKYIGVPVLTKYFVFFFICVLRKAFIFIILSYLWSTFTPTIHEIHKISLSTKL